MFTGPAAPSPTGWSPSFVPKLHIPHSHSLKVRSHTLTSRLKVYECMLYLLLPLAGSLPAHSRCSRPLLSPCVLVSSRGSGWHSTGDSAIQQKYGWKYAALWTCPEGSVFPPVFLRIAALQYTAAGQRPRAHVPCEQRPVRQGRCPLLLPQRAPPLLVTPVFAAAPAHRFTDSQQNGRPWKEHTRDEFACPGRET